MTLAYAQRPIRDQKKHAVHAPEKGAGRQCGVPAVDRGAVARSISDRRATSGSSGPRLQGSCHQRGFRAHRLRSISQIRISRARGLPFATIAGRTRGFKPRDSGPRTCGKGHQLTSRVMPLSIFSTSIDCRTAPRITASLTPISKVLTVRRQNIRHNSRRRLAECGPRQGVDVRRRTCGAASADVRWSVA